MGIDFVLSDAMRARLLKAGVPEEHHNRKDLQVLLLDSYGSVTSRELTLEELAEVVVFFAERRAAGDRVSRDAGESAPPSGRSR